MDSKEHIGIQAASWQHSLLPLSYFYGLNPSPEHSTTPSPHSRFGTLLFLAKGCSFTFQNSITQQWKMQFFIYISLHFLAWLWKWCLCSHAPCQFLHPRVHHHPSSYNLGIPASFSMTTGKRFQRQLSLNWGLGRHINKSPSKLAWLQSTPETQQDLSCLQTWENDSIRICNQPWGTTMQENSVHCSSACKIVHCMSEGASCSLCYALGKASGQWRPCNS